MNAKERKALLLAEGVLEQLQWDGGDEEFDSACPLCGGANLKDEDRETIAEDALGHSSTCRLMQALTAVKGVLFEGSRA